MRKFRQSLFASQVGNLIFFNRLKALYYFYLVSVQIIINLIILYYCYLSNNFEICGIFIVGHHVLQIYVLLGIDRHCCVAV